MAEKNRNNKKKNNKGSNSNGGGGGGGGGDTTAPPSMTVATESAETETEMDPAGGTDGADAGPDPDPTTPTPTVATEDQPKVPAEPTTAAAVVAAPAADDEVGEEKDNEASEVDEKEEQNVAKEDNDQVKEEEEVLEEEKDQDQPSAANVESPVLKMEKSTDEESDDLEDEEEEEEETKQQDLTETEKLEDDSTEMVKTATSVEKEDEEIQQQPSSTSPSSTTTPAVAPPKEDGSIINDVVSPEQKTEDVSEETPPTEEEGVMAVDAVPSDEGGASAADDAVEENHEQTTPPQASGEDGTGSTVKANHDEQQQQQEPKVEDVPESAKAETAAVAAAGNAETLPVSDGTAKEEQRSEPDGVNGVPSDEGPGTEVVVEEKPSASKAAPEKIVAPPRQRPTGLTFAAAFGDSPPEPVVSPLASPPMIAENTPKTAPTEIETSQGTPPSDNDMKSPSTTTPNSSSGGALSASRNKKVSDRISNYVDKVAHEPLPGDAVIKRTNSNPSSLNPKMYSPKPSPQSLQVPRKMLQVDSENLPDMKSVREMFEESSKNSEKTEFEFGEEFRQKKRYEQLSGKAQEREAKMSMRGFDEVEFFQGRTASGEVDTSSLGKIFTFELSSNESISVPDGMCRVNYKKIDYKAMVFVVHRTRGMLLLHVAMPGGDKASRQIPGGSVNEDEFLRAAQQSGSSQVQLQIAAREAAARQLYERTGLDMRDDVDRFKPAVLKMYTQVDARGVQYPKNEHANKLYYFLQVDEDDFEALAASSNGHNEGGEPTKLIRPSEDPGDSPLALKLGEDYTDFTFVQDPVAASKVLKKGGDSEVTTALQMIMTEAEKDGAPDAKASEYSPKGDSVADSTPVDEKTGHLVRTVGLNDDGGEKKVDSHGEADIKHKPSNDTTDAAAEVQCCCGWW